MDEAIKAFIEVRNQRSEAKAKVMDALGRAKLADYRGEDSSALWEAVERYGTPRGIEGRLTQQMQDMADTFVAAHPQLFVNVDGFATEEAKTPQFAGVDNDGEHILVSGHDALIQLIDTMRRLGDVEGTERLVMFELARFARQNIGTPIGITIRPVGGN